MSEEKKSFVPLPSVSISRGQTWPNDLLVAPLFTSKDARAAMIPTRERERERDRNSVEGVIETANQRLVRVEKQKLARSFVYFSSREEAKAKPARSEELREFRRRIRNGRTKKIYRYLYI